MGKIILISGNNSTEITTPQYGYEIEISLAMNSTESTDGVIYWADNGPEYDTRVSSLKWLLNYLQTEKLQTYLIKNTHSRDKDLNVDLPYRSGFFIFGPDCGDTGRFVCDQIDILTDGMIYKPYRYFETGVQLVMKTKPEYQFPQGKNQGKFTIGDVTGLMQPQEKIRNKHQLALTKTTSLGGIVSGLDIGSDADKYDAEFSIIANTGKMAELVKHLIVDVRGNPFPILNTSKNYLFGALKNDCGTYNCQLKSNKLKLTHNRFNEWTINLQVRYLGML